MRKLSEDPEKRRHQIFRRLYNIYYEWGALIEAGEMDHFLVTPDGETVYRGDLLVGLDSLAPKQRLAFKLLCLEGMTESQASEVAFGYLECSTPVQQYADTGLKKMVKAYDEKQAKTYISPAAKKRIKELIRQREELNKKAERTTVVEIAKTAVVSSKDCAFTLTRLGSRQKSILEELRAHAQYFKGCGWLYLSHSETVEVLDSLVNRGIVEVDVRDGQKVYTLVVF